MKWTPIYLPPNLKIRTLLVPYLLIPDCIPFSPLQRGNSTVFNFTLSFRYFSLPSRWSFFFFSPNIMTIGSIVFYHMQTFCIISIILKITQWSRCHYPHFTDKETEIQGFKWLSESWVIIGWAGSFGPGPLVLDTCYTRCPAMQIWTTLNVHPHVICSADSYFVLASCLSSGI